MIDKWVIEDVLGETVRSKVCLRQLINDRSLQLLMLHQHYKNGVLPYAGGIFDQYNVFVQGMSIIDDRSAKILMERMRAQKLHK